MHLGYNRVDAMEISPARYLIQDISGPAIGAGPVYTYPDQALTTLPECNCPIRPRLIHVRMEGPWEVLRL